MLFNSQKETPRHKAHGPDLQPCQNVESLPKNTFSQALHLWLTYFPTIYSSFWRLYRDRMQSFEGWEVLESPSKRKRCGNPHHWFPWGYMETQQKPEPRRSGKVRSLCSSWKFTCLSLLLNKAAVTSFVTQPWPSWHPLSRTACHPSTLTCSILHYLWQLFVALINLRFLLGVCFIREGSSSCWRSILLNLAADTWLVIQKVFVLCHSSSSSWP